VGQAQAAAAAPVVVDVSAPTKVAYGQGIGLSLSAKGAHIAGLQAQIMVNGRAAEIGGVAPLVKGARSLSPVAVKGGANVGVYAIGRSHGSKLAGVALFPRVRGRVEIRIGAVEVVDANGHRLAVRLEHDRLVVQVGTAKKLFAAGRPGIAPAAGAAKSRPDIDADGHVTRDDLNEALYGWAAADKSGDTNHDGRVDVADLQAIAGRMTTVKHFSPQAAGPPLTFTVNSTADANDATPGDRVCLTAGGVCTLRAAIDEANRHSGPDTIAFNIPGGAPQTIQLSLGKLVLNQPGTTIDGYTEPGAHPNTDPTVSNAQPGVEIRGNGDSAKESIYITKSDTVIQGLALDRMWKTIWLDQGASNNTIAGNFIGINGLGQNIGYSGVAGVLINAGAHDNIIGLPTLAGRNVIASVSEGIDLYDTGTDRNIYRNNLIGISPNGTQAYGIGDNGIDHNFGPKNNVAGGFGPLDRNVIAGAGNDGVEFSHGWNQAFPPAQDTSLPYQINDNQVLGNYIGFKADGSYDPAFANGHCFPGCETNDNGQGINVIDGSNRTIVDGNWIDGLRSGIQVNAAWSTGNIIRNNHIGVAPNGGNGTINRYGVWLHWNTKQNQVINNEIANTGWAGISLDSPSVYDNLISRNTFRNVGSPAIDMYPLQQVNVNGAQPLGADHAVFYPVITSASTSSVSGTAPKGAAVEVYLSWNDPGQNGPGRTYLGTATASSTGSGAWSLPVSLNPGDVVTATASVNNLNTSEFGVNVAVPGAPPKVHGVTFSTWTGFSGNGMNNIPLGTAANTVSRLDVLEAPVNRGDNLGTRLQALVTAPTTGTYTFWIASDDNGRLMLSSNSDPANRQLIAHVDVWTNSEAWDTYASQQSAPVNLVAGQQYYIEAFSKEGNGGDNLAVAWSGPGISRQVIPVDYLQPTTDGCAGWCPNAPAPPTNALLQSFTGQCLDVWGASTADGTQVTQYTCHGQSNQRWTLTAGGAMQVYSSPAKCLMPQGGSLAVGTMMVISTCNGSAVQTFSQTAAGEFKVGGMCMEVQGASTAAGALAVLDNCNSSPEQKWSFAS
jgi:CSLREA domain-containing protein